MLLLVVMPAPVAGIHVLNAARKKTWMAGKSPTMTSYRGNLNSLDALLMSVPAEHVIAVRVRGRGEMVDARDLKSLGSNFPCRFKSGRPHQALHCTFDNRISPLWPVFSSCNLQVRIKSESIYARFQTRHNRIP